MVAKAFPKTFLLGFFVLKNIFVWTLNLCLFWFDLIMQLTSAVEVRKSIILAVPKSRCIACGRWDLSGWWGQREKGEKRRQTSELSNFKWTCHQGTISKGKQSSNHHFSADVRVFGRVMWVEGNDHYFLYDFLSFGILKIRSLKFQPGRGGLGLGVGGSEKVRSPNVATDCWVERLKGRFFFQRFLFVCVVKSYYHVMPSNLKWSKHLRFFIPIFSEKSPQVMKYNSWWVIYLDSHPFLCYALFTKIFKSNISTTYVALALWPCHQWWVPKSLRACFDLRTFRWISGGNLGAGSHQTKHFSIFKTRQPSEILLTWEKKGRFFGRWENPEKKCPKMVWQILQRGFTEASRPKHLPIFWTSAVRSSRQTRVLRFGEGSWESRFGVWRPVGKGEKSYPFVEQDHFVFVDSFFRLKSSHKPSRFQKQEAFPY